jgi:ABC-type transport system substrate-binding protein
VGVNVTLNPIDPANLPSLRRGGQLKGALLIASGASAYFELAFIGPVTYASTSANHNIADPGLDAIINNIAVATDINERSKLGTDFTDYVYNNLPELPLLGLPSFLAHGPKVDLKTQAAIGYLLTWYLRAV